MDKHRLFHIKENEQETRESKELDSIRTKLMSENSSSCIHRRQEANSIINNREKHRLLHEKKVQEIREIEQYENRIDVRKFFHKTKGRIIDFFKRRRKRKHEKVRRLNSMKTEDPIADSDNFFRCSKGLY